MIIKFKKETNIPVLIHLFIINRLHSMYENILGKYLINMCLFCLEHKDKILDEDEIIELYSASYYFKTYSYVQLRLQDVYLPDIERFTTEDPIRYGLNWYAYANNNPLRFVDPTGLDTIYAGAALTATSPNRMILNFLNKVQDHFDSTAPDWFETKVDSISVSGGIYIDTEGGFGFYGTVGAGGGTPDVSAGVEVGSSKLSPDEFLSGTTTEVGGGVGAELLSIQEGAVFSETGEHVGTEYSLSLGLGLPVDLHVDVENAAHVGFDFTPDVNAASDENSSSSDKTSDE